MQSYRLLTLTIMVCVCEMALAGDVRGLIEPCETKYGPLDVIKAVRVEACEKTPCSMKSQHNYSMEVDFVPTISSDTLKVKAYGDISGLELAWPGMKTDACQVGQVQCPIAAGKQYTYKINVHINKMYPKIKLHSNWYFYGGDQNKVSITCFRVALHLIA